MTPAQKTVFLIIAERGPLTAAAIATHRFGHPGYALRTERVCSALAGQGLVQPVRAGWRLTEGGRRRLRELPVHAAH